MDAPGTHTRLAIVARTDLVYGIARMYTTYREVQSEGSERVEVFRSMSDALEWLRPEPPD